MASLELDPASGRFRVRFRYSGQSYKRSLRTKQRRVAMASLGQIAILTAVRTKNIRREMPKIGTRISFFRAAPQRAPMFS